MKIISTLILISACITLLSGAGCLTQQTAQSPVTQVITTQETPAMPVTTLPLSTPATIATTIPSTTQQTVDDSLPQQVTILPPTNEVDIGIEKDRVYNTITVTFIGGRGQVLVKSILVRVTTSDGVTELKNIPVGDQVSTGASVDMKGTRGPDRVEVFVNLGGVMYKLKDENMTYAYY